ncbi:MAG: hypothetical protein ACLSDT_11850, partial [Blautia sp.]
PLNAVFMRIIGFSISSLMKINIWKCILRKSKTIMPETFETPFFNVAVVEREDISYNIKKE